MALTLYRISTTGKLVVTDNTTPPTNGVVVSSPLSNSLAHMTTWYEELDSSYAGWTPNRLAPTTPEVYDTTPPILILTGDAQAFTFNGLNALTPATQSITFSLNKQNILDATVWDTVSDVGGVTNLLTTTTDTSAILTSASFNTNAFVQVTATCGLESDTFTVMRLTDGATNLIGYLTNETHSVPATSTGGTSASGTFTGAGGTFKVYYGLDEVTNACTFAGTAGNCTGTVVTTGTTGRGAYSITAITSTTTDVATYSILATHPTYGDVTKVFTISKSKAGSSNIKATLNNDTHVFPATSGGNIPAGSYTGSGTNINVYDGVKELSYDGIGVGAGTTAGKYTISSTPTNITRGTLTSTVVAGSNPSINYVVVGAHSGVADATDASAIVYTITGVDLNGTTFSITAQQSFSKSKAGTPGVDGAASALFSINNSASAFNKNAAGTISPTTLTLTTTTQNFAASPAPTYQWQKNETNIATGGTSASLTITAATDYPSGTTTNTYKCTITGTINGVASSTLNDSITIPLLVDGVSVPTVVLSNENSTFPALVSGYTGITFTGGNCNITAFIGSTQLTYAASGANTFSCTNSSTGATVAAGIGSASTFAVLAPTAVSAETAYTDVVTTIRDASNTALSTITKRINYSLSRAGDDSTYFSITNSATSFIKGINNVILPATLTLSTAYSNITSPTYQWAKSIDGGAFTNITTGGTSATYIITASTDYATATTNAYKCTLTGTVNGSTGIAFSDLVTIPLLTDSKSVATVVLSNENTTFSAPLSGFSIPSFAGGGCDVTAYIGTTKLTPVTISPLTSASYIAALDMTTTAGDQDATYDALTGTLTCTKLIKTISAVDTTTNVVTLTGHGFQNALSTVIVAGISTVYARPINANTFYLTTTISRTLLGALTLTNKYVIYSLGTTTDQTEWNTIGGTSAAPITYAYGTIFTCANIGTGMGDGLVIPMMDMVVGGTVAANTTITDIDWNSSGYSTTSAPGGAKLTFKAVTTATLMCGLNVDPITNNNYSSIDYCFYLTGSSIRIYEGGSSKYSGGAYLATDVFTILYNNDTVSYYHNQTCLRTVDVAKGLTFYFDSSFATGNAFYPNSINSIGFAAYTAVGANTFTYTINTTATGITVSPNVVSQLIAITAPTGVNAETEYTDVLISPRDAADNALASITKRINYSLSRTGATGTQGDLGPTVTITANNPLVFKSVDKKSIAGNDIILTANTTGMTGQTYAWTSTGFDSSPAAGTASFYTVTSTAFTAIQPPGGRIAGKVTCTVTYNSVTYTDVVTIARLESSSAAANATVGADASNLNTGVGTNMIPNSDFTDGISGCAAGWQQFVGAASNPVLNNAGPDWQPDGMNTVGHSAVAGVGYMDTALPKVVCSPNTRYEIFAYLAGHRCYAQVLFVFYDAAGVYITEGSFQNLRFGTLASTGGTTLASFEKTGGFATSPWNAVFLQISLRSTAEDAGQTSKYAWGTRFFAAPVTTYQTVLSPWTKAPSATTEHIQDNAITDIKSIVTYANNIPTSTTVVLVSATGGAVGSGNLVFGSSGRASRRMLFIVSISLKSATSTSTYSNTLATHTQWDIGINSLNSAGTLIRNEITWTYIIHANTTAYGQDITLSGYVDITNINVAQFNVQVWQNSGSPKATGVMQLTVMEVKK